MTDAAKLARNLCVTEQEIRDHSADSFERMNERQRPSGWWVLPTTFAGAVAAWLLG